MGKIAIISYVTHSSHLNYGATLHGFAFQYYLKSRYGICSNIIRYVPKALAGENLKYPILNAKGNRSLINNIIIKLNWLLGFRANLKKWRKFNGFIDNILQTTRKTYSYEVLLNEPNEELQKFDMFVCEADVIWKIQQSDNIDENFFLAFPAATESIKVAYAPTVASKKMQGDVLERFKRLTTPFAAISSREKRGAQYLSEVLNREVPYVLDPTLLLTAADYDHIISEPNVDRDYLLVYVCTVNDREMVKAATEYGRAHNLKVIEISNYWLNRFVVSHEVKVDAGIEEWLGYFKNAKMVISNSFHGVCFSIIFKKDFFVFQRDNKDYRMQDILESLNLENRLIPYYSKQIPKTVTAIDFSDVDTRLDILRKNSDDYIRQNICNHINNH